MRSLVLTSQLPVSRWHEQIGDPTVADGILDRLVHNAHRIEMRGDSMRKAGNNNRKLAPPEKRLSLRLVLPRILSQQGLERLDVRSG